MSERLARKPLIWAGSSFPRSELWRQSGRAAASISVLGDEGGCGEATP